MLDNGVEVDLLKEFAKKLVMRKEEIVEFLSKRVKDPYLMARVVTQSLVERGLITSIYPGASSFAITKRGMMEVRKV